MWQSLSFGANYKAAYCLAVCPAGEDVIRPFLDDRAGFLEEVVRPLQDKEETIYVVAGSDAEDSRPQAVPRQAHQAGEKRPAPAFDRRLSCAACRSSFQPGRSESSMRSTISHSPVRKAARQPSRFATKPFGSRWGTTASPTCTSSPTRTPGWRSWPRNAACSGRSAPPQDPHQGLAEALVGLRPMFPVTKSGRTPPNRLDCTFTGWV